jgi:geranylgeranyl reductase family protein
VDYDVVIAGGSIAGLFCAREIANNGHSVLVLEEDFEIGTPEHCGGLVSTSGLEELGIIPRSKTFDHMIESAEVYAPNGNSFTINSKKQKVAEINRRELDKQIAHQAQKNGADIKVKTSFQEFTKDGVRTSDGEIKCKIIVDARGVTALINKDREGILSSAQYEVYADWIKKGKVEVYFDQEKYPGFFAWIIPSGEGTGKVGVAGSGINAAVVLEDFLSKKGKFSTIRKIFAPIWIKGPIEKFVSDRVVTVGDAAGQSKPTTAGGIFSCFARKLLERLDNQTINKLFESITPEIVKDISEKDDFDFHTSSIVKLLGMKGSIKTAQTIIGGEIKKLLP